MTKVVKSKKQMKDGWEYFDDCGICQAMKIADKKGKSLGARELEIAFSKQNLKNKLKRR